MRTFVLAFAAVALAVGGGYAAYWREQTEWRTALAEVQGDREKLRESLARTKEENARLLERMAVVDRGQQVQSKAYADVDAHLRTLQDQVAALQEEVAFYRGIVSSDQGSGVAIQRFVLIDNGIDDTYRFALVLTRNLRNDNVAVGTVSLSVAGERDGRPESLSLAQLSTGGGPKFAFEFRYFQRLEGTIRIPPGFRPRQVSVLVSAPEERPSSFERSFEWESVLG